MKSIKTFLVNTMLAVISTLLTFFVVEYCYRFIKPNPQMQLEKLLNKYEPDFIDRISELDTRAIHGNRCSYPSTKKDSNTFRILMLGDSMTHGTGLKCLYTYPRKLEILLNEISDGKKYEIINLAYPGFDTSDAYDLYQNFKDIEHDAVILGIYFNDIHLISSKIFKTAEDHRLYLEKKNSIDILKKKFKFSQAIQDFIDTHYGEKIELNNPKGLDFFSTHFAKLAQSVKANKSDFMAIFLPQIEIPNDESFMELIQSVKNIVMANKIELMDLSHVFEGFESTVFRQTYRDIHWSRSANNIIAEELINYISQHKLFGLQGKKNTDSIRKIFDSRQIDHYKVVPVEDSAIKNFLIEYKNNGARNEARYSYFDGFGNAINSNRIMIGSLIEPRPIFRKDWDPKSGYMPQVFYKTRSKYLEDSYEKNVTKSETATYIYCIEDGECELKYKVDSLSKIIEGKMQIMARMYHIGGVLEAHISEDGSNFESIYKVEHKKKGWINYEEIIDLTDHIKNKIVFYVKFVWKNHSKNDWVALNQWGISLRVTPEEKKMGISPVLLNDVYRFSGSKRLTKDLLEPLAVHQNLKIRGKVW
jgi:hypothetical protein